MKTPNKWPLRLHASATKTDRYETGTHAINSNYKAPNEEKKDNKISLGIQCTDSITQFRRCLYMLLSNTPSLSPPTRIFKLPNPPARATRAELDCVAIEERTPRLTAQAKRCKQTHEAYDPKISSSAPRRSEGLPSADLISPGTILGTIKERPQSGTDRKASDAPPGRGQIKAQQPLV
jgi:hypothetical protein